MFLSLLFLQSPTGLAKLNFLLGNWTSIETTIGATGQASEIRLKGKNELVLAGQYIQIDENFTVDGKGNYQNKILMSYDSPKKIYHAWWFTNSMATPIEFTGKFDADGFALQSVEREGMMALRIAYNVIKSDSFAAHLQGLSNGKWTNLTDAQYTRAK